MNTLAKIRHTLRLLGPWRAARLAAEMAIRPNPIHLWRTDPEFSELYRGVERHTLVDRRRAFMLFQWARQAALLEGHVAEVGVYRGGTARLIARIFAGAGKRVLLFDTFAAMPETDSPDDFVRAGDFGDTSLEAVRAVFEGSPHVEIIAGRFPETAKEVSDERFCFVHVDVDMYRSVHDCCEFFFPRLVPGGVMIFDDYGFLSTRSARSAVDQYFEGRMERPIYLPTGQCLVCAVGQSRVGSRD